jgi:hypothetical protein
MPSAILAREGGRCGRRARGLRGLFDQIDCHVVEKMPGGNYAWPREYRISKYQECNVFASGFAGFDACGLSRRTT